MDSLKKSYTVHNVCTFWKTLGICLVFLILNYIFRDLWLVFGCRWSSRCTFRQLIQLQGFSVGRFDYNKAWKSHDPLKFNSSYWLELQHSDWSANLVEDFLLQIKFSPMRKLEFLWGHVIIKLRYNQIDQLKTTFKGLRLSSSPMKSVDWL